MQPRIAALLFALGLVDLAYVNLGLGREVFADAASQPSIEGSPPAVEEPEDEPMAREPSPAFVDPRAAEPAAIEPDVVTRQAEPPEAPPTLEPSPGVAPPTPEPTPAGTQALPGALEPAPRAAHTGASAADTHALAVERAPSAPAPPAKGVHATPADDDTAQRVPGVPGTDLRVGFPDKATALLTSRARQELLALATHLREHPEYRIHIVGHADARGSREFNLDLGDRRARAVTELLVRAGVPRRQIETESRGEDEPRAIGASERVWAANRRVEITLGNERSETP
jgi:peptidoglycan-associated lipoprotein